MTDAANRGSSKRRFRDRVAFAFYRLAINCAERAGATILHCPFHEQRDPLLAAWPTHYVCYECGSRGEIDELRAMLSRVGRAEDLI